MVHSNNESASIHCVSFDLTEDNANTRHLLASKQDLAHMQYVLIWKDKMSSFNCYKVVRDKISDLDHQQYMAFTTDLKFHNLIGYGPNGGVYAIKNRFDYDLTYSALCERLKRAEWRQSTGYKHKILVAGMPYQLYPLEFKTVEFGLGFSIIPKTRMVTKFEPLSPIDTDTLHQRQLKRQQMYSEM